MALTPEQELEMAKSNLEHATTSVEWHKHWLGFWESVVADAGKKIKTLEG